MNKRLTPEERQKKQDECIHQNYPIMFARDVSDPKRKHAVQLCSNCSKVLDLDSV
jgi:hypothetical protein